MNSGDGIDKKGTGEYTKDNNFKKNVSYSCLCINNYSIF
jgi:hypothetical protein